MEEPKVMEDCWTIIIPDVTGPLHHELNTRPVQYQATQHYSMKEKTHEVPPLTGKLSVLSAVGLNRLPILQQVSLKLYTFSQLDSVGYTQKIKILSLRGFIIIPPMKFL